MCRQVFHHPRKQSSSRHNSDLGRQMPSLGMLSPFLLPLVWCAEHGAIRCGMSLCSVGVSWPSCAPFQLLVQHQLCGSWGLCRSVGQRECEEWKLWLVWLERCMCTVTHLEWTHGATAAAIRQVPSWGGEALGTWPAPVSQGSTELLGLMILDPILLSPALVHTCS